MFSASARLQNNYSTPILQSSIWHSPTSLSLLHQFDCKTILHCVQSQPTVPLN